MLPTRLATHCGGIRCGGVGGCEVAVGWSRVRWSGWGGEERGKGREVLWRKGREKSSSSGGSGRGGKEERKARRVRRGERRRGEGRGRGGRMGEGGVVWSRWSGRGG